jgi:hypothetical protein
MARCWQKLYAIFVNKGVVDWSERAGLRAAGQAGFRKDHWTADQIVVLRTLMKSTRARGTPVHLLRVFQEGVRFGGWEVALGQARMPWDTYRVA